MSAERAAAMRRAFDATFAELRLEPVETRGFLILRVAAERYAVALADVASVHADRRVVPVPTARAELLGVASFRGALAPVYDLGLFLGAPRVDAPRWLLLLRAPELVGLAFDGLDAHLRLDAARVVPGTGRARSPLLRGVLRTDEAAIPLLDTASLLAAVKADSGTHPPPEDT